MRQVLRRYAFPYMIIAAVLAVALPFSCFASELVSVNENQLFQIWGANNWNYFKYTSNETGTYKQYYQYNDSSIPQVSNGLTVSGRLTSFRLSASVNYIRVRIPLLLTNVESFESNIYFGLYHINEDGTYHDSTSSVLAEVVTCYSRFNDSYSLPTGYVSSTQSYVFRPVDSVSDDWVNLNKYFTMRRLRVYSKWTEPTPLYYIWLSFSLNVDSDRTQYFFIGMGDDAEFTAPDQGSANIVNGLNGVQSSIDSLVSSMQETQGQLLDEVGNVVAELQSDAFTTIESEQMYTNAVSKGEQLDQLGDSLSNVPKPNINSVTSVVKPTVTLNNTNPELVQSALSVIYSWDRLLAILAVVIALGTISYILFGKKG